MNTYWNEEGTQNLPIAMRFQFVEHSSIAVLEDEMKFMLSLRFEYFDEIDEILML